MSTPAETVFLPSLEGLSLGDAEARLAIVGLARGEIVHRSGQGADGTVVASDPPGGSEVPTRSRVNLVCCKRPARTGRPPVFTERAIELSGFGLEATASYGTALIGVPSRSLFMFSTPTGTGASLHVLSPETGSHTLVTKAAGLLRDAVPSSSGDRLWLLTTNGLHEFSCDSLSITKTVKKGIPKSPQMLFPVRRDRVLGIGTRGTKTVTFVSTDTFAVVGKCTAPEADLAIEDVAGGAVLASFSSGSRWQLGPDLKARGKPATLPSSTRGVGMDRVPATPKVGGRGLVYALSRDGGVVSVDSATWQVARRGPGNDLERIVGFDAAGRLVAFSRDAVVIVDSDDLLEVARHRLERFFPGDLIGPSSVAVLPEPQRLERVRIVGWD